MRCTKLFRDAKLAPPLFEAVKNAGLTHFKPLVISTLGIIWTELSLCVGRGQSALRNSTTYKLLTSLPDQSMLFIPRVGERMASTALSPSTSTLVLCPTSTSRCMSWCMHGPSVLTPKPHHCFKPINSISSRPSHSYAVCRARPSSIIWG